MGFEFVFYYSYFFQFSNAIFEGFLRLNHAGIIFLWKYRPKTIRKTYFYRNRRLVTYSAQKSETQIKVFDNYCTYSYHCQKHCQMGLIFVSYLTWDQTRTNGSHFCIFSYLRSTLHKWVVFLFPYLLKIKLAQMGLIFVVLLT